MSAPILVCGECYQRSELCNCPASVRRTPLVDLRKVIRDRERATERAS